MDIKKIIKEYYEELYANKFDVGKFWNKHKKARNIFTVL